MPKLNINGGGYDQGDRISDMEGGEFFVFSGSRKNNNGPCVRVKDSKAGKARFVHLETGKLLKASKGDRGRSVEGYLDYED